MIKRKSKSKNYKDFLFKNKAKLESQQRFKSEGYITYTEEINEIALSSNDDKRLLIFDKITTYPYGTDTFKISKIEMINKYK